MPDLDDWAFLRDLGLIKSDADTDRLTIAGLLFVGKEDAIRRLLPQAEIIYLHYNKDNFEEYARIISKLPLFLGMQFYNVRPKTRQKGWPLRRIAALEWRIELGITGIASHGS